MLKHILRIIGQLKTPERRLNVIMPLAATIVLFFLLIRGSNGHETELKEQVRTLQHDKDSIRRVMQVEVDQLKLENYEALQKHNKILESILRDQDTVKTSLKKKNLKL